MSEEAFDDDACPHLTIKEYIAIDQASLDAIKYVEVDKSVKKIDNKFNF